MKASERVLRVILWLLALDAAIGGAVLLLGGRAVFIWLFPHVPASEVSDLLLFRQKPWGGLGVALTIRGSGGLTEGNCFILHTKFPLYVGSVYRESPIWVRRSFLVFGLAFAT